MDTFPITAQFSLSSWWPVATCLRTYPLALHTRSAAPSKPPTILYQWGSERVGALWLAGCTTFLPDSARPLSAAGKQATGCSAQFFSPGGTLATGERDRTEKKEVVVTHTILFYGAAVPAECYLPQPASQKFSSPFPLPMAQPLTPGRGLRDRDFSVASFLSCSLGRCPSVSQEVFSSKVLALRL